MELIEADVLAKESANVAKKQRKKNTMDDESWNWEGRRLGNANLLKISFVLEYLKLDAVFIGLDIDNITDVAVKIFAVSVSSLWYKSDK